MSYKPLGTFLRTEYSNQLSLLPDDHSSSAVMSLGAATLADIYDPAERGTMMGIYYRSVYNESLRTVI